MPSQGTHFRPARSAMSSLTRSANASAVSPSPRVCGSMYHTSATSAQDVISRVRWDVNPSRREFQNASTKILLY